MSKKKDACPYCNRTAPPMDPASVEAIRWVIENPQRVQIDPHFGGSAVDFMRFPKRPGKWEPIAIVDLELYAQLLAGAK